MLGERLSDNLGAGRKDDVGREDGRHHCVDVERRMYDGLQEGEADMNNGRRGGRSQWARTFKNLRGNRRDLAIWGCAFPLRAALQPSL